MRSCLYLSLIAFTSGFVFRLFKVNVVLAVGRVPSSVRVVPPSLSRPNAPGCCVRIFVIFRSAVKRSTLPEDTSCVFISMRSMLCNEAKELWNNFFLSRVFPELTHHRVRAHFVQNLSRRHTLTAFSNGNSCSTPPCVRFGLYQKIRNNGHALLAVRPTTNPASTCRDAFVSVACLSLKGEESGKVIGDPECSSGLFQSPLEIRKTDGECYAEDPKLSSDESSSPRSFLGLKRSEVLSARRVEERSGLRWGLDANLLSSS